MFIRVLFQKRSCVGLMYFIYYFRLLLPLWQALWKKWCACEIIFFLFFCIRRVEKSSFDMLDRHEICVNILRAKKFVSNDANDVTSWRGWVDSITSISVVYRCADSRVQFIFVFCFLIFSFLVFSVAVVTARRLEYRGYWFWFLFLSFTHTKFQGDFFF